MKEYRLFGDRVRRRRLEKGLTMVDVSRALGISIPYISELERGAKQPPAGDLIERLAKFLDIDGSELYDLAAKSRRSVAVDLEGLDGQKRAFAVMLARRLQEGMTDEEMELITEIVRRREGLGND